jgi:hypothetical protein
MNAFYEHHKDSIEFGYSCFDRMVLDARIPAFLDGARTMGFFSQHRNLFPVFKKDLVRISEQYEQWMKACASQQHVKILNVEEVGDRRDEFMEPYFAGAQPDQIVGIIKAREPVRIMTAISNKGSHLEPKLRWVNQYNYYLQDQNFGPMFVRICPYFPFTARLCLNQHDWIAQRLRQQGMGFEQRANSFVACDDPEALQRIEDTFTAEDLIACGRKWIDRLVPFFSKQERRYLGCDHQFYFKQVEYCDNLIFHKRAALDALHDRLLDSNRKLGSPNQVAVMFGCRITRQHKGKLQTTIEDLHLGQPVIRALFKHSLLKNYVRPGNVEFGGVDRVEVATKDVTDFRQLLKGVENLEAVRKTFRGVTDRFRDRQQDILETFLDRGELHALAQTTVSANGKRIPGLKLDHPRQLAVMHSRVSFSNILAGQFMTKDLHPRVLCTLGCKAEQYPLNSLRYDLSKLRAKGLVEKIPGTRRYQLTESGYRVCVIYLKLFHKLYAPLAAGIINPYAGDARLPLTKTSGLDQLYLAVSTALDRLVEAVGLKVAA